MRPEKLRERAEVLHSIGSQEGPYPQVLSDARFNDLYGGWTGDGFDALAERWEAGQTSFTAYLSRVSDVGGQHATSVDQLIDDIEELQHICKQELSTHISGLDVALEELDNFWDCFWTGASWGAGGGSVAGAGIGSVAPVVGTAIGFAAGAIIGGLVGGIFFADSTEDIEREFAGTPGLDLQLSSVLNRANELTVLNSSDDLGARRYATFSHYADQELPEDFVEVQ